jgi:FHS family L-fucose permease-like MFS transporter
MILAVNAHSFPGMLAGLFTVALGFSLQQTAANPFATLLGTPETGAHRITLGGGINSFGTAIGPIIVALALFGSTVAGADKVNSLGLDKITILYTCVGLLFLLSAALFYFSGSLPAGRFESHTEPAPKALLMLLVLTMLLVGVFVPVFNSYRLTVTDPLALQSLQTERFQWLLAGLIIIVGTLLYTLFSARRNATGWGAMKYPQLVLGMLAIFTYVGTEVTIQSNMGELLRQPAFGGYDAGQVAPFISLYWGSLMIGRWTGSIKIFEPKGTLKTLLIFIVPVVAFLVVMGVNALARNDVSPFMGYLVFVLLQAVAFYLVKDRPTVTLTVFSLAGLALMIMGMALTGKLATYAFLAGGLFCSVLWPCIFALAIAGLGKYAAQGSGFLVMMILGGAIIPPLQGKLADLATVGIHYSYILPAAGFAYLAAYGILVKRILLKQGIDYDGSSSGH